MLGWQRYRLGVTAANDNPGGRLCVREPEMIAWVMNVALMLLVPLPFLWPHARNRFFLQLLCMVLLGMFSMSLFTVIGAVTRNPVLTQVRAGPRRVYDAPDVAVPPAL